ncbi:THO complex subunit 7 [Merluccius polli]|uniref:THO complex subunit 7 n=1 Tax=Merluccius polli TaxID=89951 RepID=A0AA47M7U0_MERPO|nr:THO complex subunit 7 [Merluccius polli]
MGETGTEAPPLARAETRPAEAHRGAARCGGGRDSGLDADPLDVAAEEEEEKGGGRRSKEEEEKDDHEVIRKRLLIDGDGAGDDRRINVLLKSFTKWCTSPNAPEEGFTQYQRMLSTLAQCEFSMIKTLMVYDMNIREMENYEKIYSNIEENITSAHENISECKKEIQRAKRIRKNRQEYDALAKVIQQHPDRHETLKQLEALDKELQQLSDIKENVDAKLELRKKQFHVLLSTIQELQQTLDNDDKLENDGNSQESPMENGE